MASQLDNNFHRIASDFTGNCNHLRAQLATEATRNSQTFQDLSNREEWDAIAKGHLGDKPAVWFIPVEFSSDERLHSIFNAVVQYIRNNGGELHIATKDLSYEDVIGDVMMFEGSNRDRIDSLAKGILTPPPQPTQGELDFLAFLKHVNIKEKTFITTEKKKLIDSNPRLVESFAASVKEGSCTTFWEKGIEQVSLLSLAALRLGLLTERQVATLHMQIGAIDELVLNPISHDVSQVEGDKPPYIELPPYEGKVTDKFKVHHYRAENFSTTFKKNLGFVDDEWEYFCKLMGKEDPSEQYCSFFEVPKYFVKNPMYQKTIQLLSIFHLIEGRDENTLHLIVPSFSMMQNRLEAFAHFLGEEECPRLIPLFGDINFEDIASMKASGQSQFGLYCPEQEPESRKRASNKSFMRSFDGYEGGAPLVFFQHEFYHVMKDMLTKVKHRYARCLVVFLFKEYAKGLSLFWEKKYIENFAEKLTDGDMALPTTTIRHPVILSRVTDPKEFGTGNRFVDTVQHIAHEELGLLFQYSPLRDCLIRAFQKIKEHARQHEKEWKENFGLSSSDLILCL